MTKPKIHTLISAFEVQTCAGPFFQDLWQGCLEGKSFIDPSGFGRIQNKVNPEESIVQYTKRVIDKLEAVDAKRIGIILATTTGNTPLWEDKLIQWLQNSDKDSEQFIKSFAKAPLGVLLNNIKKQLNILGPDLSLSTACSASTHALGLGHFWIQSNKVDRCFIVASEVLCKLTEQGFASFNLLSPGPCKPFDKNRTGINLSEAVGCICLEKKNTLDKEDIQIVGFGSSTDVFQMTSPDPEGLGIKLSIEGALKNAGVSKKQVDLIYTHGTASYYNDLSEAKAIHKMWGQEKPDVFSTKGVHGHSLGASALVEVCLLVEAMKKGICLPTVGFDIYDPEIGFEPVKKVKECNIKYAVKNTLGFGGANATLLFKKGI